MSYRHNFKAAVPSAEVPTHRINKIFSRPKRLEGPCGINIEM